MARLHTSVDDCPFCPMFEFNDASYINIEPLNPVVAGHRIFIPRQHVHDFTDDASVSALVMQAVALYLRYSEGDFNVITSIGDKATQSVGHLHVHVVPRDHHDGLALPWTGQKRVGDAIPSNDSRS